MWSEEVEYVSFEIPCMVLVLYWVCASIDRNRLQTLAGMPSRCASIDGSSMTIRSKHDFASLSNVDPFALDNRMIEYVQCFRCCTS